MKSCPPPSPHQFTMKAALVVLCGCLQMITTARTSVSARTVTSSTLHNSRLRRECTASDNSTLKTITRNTGEESELSGKTLTFGILRSTHISNESDVFVHLGFSNSEKWHCWQTIPKNKCEYRKLIILRQFSVEGNKPQQHIL